MSIPKSFARSSARQIVRVFIALSLLGSTLGLSAVIPQQQAQASERATCYYKLIANGGYKIGGLNYQNVVGNTSPTDCAKLAADTGWTTRS